MRAFAIGSISVALALGGLFGVATGQNLVVTQPAIGSTLPANVLSDLPVTDLFAVVETTQAEAVSERISSGGLNAGRATRIGAFMGSPSQTELRIGEVNVSDGGVPLLF